MIDLLIYATLCAPNVSNDTLTKIIKVESNGHPYAIAIAGSNGVGGLAGRLSRQPTTLQEALTVIKKLDEKNLNYSVGLMQINKIHHKKYGMVGAKMFDICLNMNVGQKILQDCYYRAMQRYKQDRRQLSAMLSCYYSGNFTRGLKKEGKYSSYVDKVLLADKIRYIKMYDMGFLNKK